MTSQDFRLENFAFSFDGHSDCGRDEVELSIQSRFQGIHPKGVDYLIQAQRDRWLVNGTSPIGSRACASVCRGLNLTPVRLDVACVIMATTFSFDNLRVATLEYFKAHKPTTTIFEYVKPDTYRVIRFGTRVSRFALVIEEFPLSNKITWVIRDRAGAAWDILNYFETAIEYREACFQLFAACTNTYLGPDFFALDHPKDLSLKVEKAVDVEQDWWAYLSSVAKKVTSKAAKEKSQHLVVQSIQFLEQECFKAVQREAKESNEKSIRDRQAGLEVVK